MNFLIFKVFCEKKSFNENNKKSSQEKGPRPPSPNWNTINDKKSIVSSVLVSCSIFACNSTRVQQ